MFRRRALSRSAAPECQSESIDGMMWSNQSGDVNGKRAGSYGRGHQGQRNQSDQPGGERIDTTSAADELVFHVSGANAQFERRQISLRTKDGLAPAR